MLALYDPAARSKVFADASSFVLGAVLLQERSAGEWRPVPYASCSYSETEKCYEQEALVVTWSFEKFLDYILGSRFEIETDHKPLVPSKHLNDLPPRVLRFRLRMAKFNYSISHVPGRLLMLAHVNSLSRYFQHQSNNWRCIVKHKSEMKCLRSYENTARWAG